ncbi:MAG: hypothetical protein HQL37_13765 [Alphaproteobacteria bacterium]|nr:hypothetical protein [Alphaproteobacteria bacterium]
MAITPIQRRLVEAASKDAALELGFLHSVMCQVCLPYRNPGDDVRRWERRSGAAVLLLDAGDALDPQTAQVVPMPLPWGAKARMVLLYLNAQAVRQGTPVIETGDTMTAFMRKVLGFQPNGHVRRSFRGRTHDRTRPRCPAS